MRGYKVLLLLPLTLLHTVCVGPARGQEIVALGTLPGLPPVPVTRVPSQCADRLLSCADRTARGECHTQPQDMLVNCAVSCGSCLPTVPSECVDRAVGRNCFYAALLGECTANPAYHLAYCAGSCREHIDVCREQSRRFGESCSTPLTVRGSTTGCGYRGASSSGADLQRRRRSVEDISEVTSPVNSSITSGLSRGGPDAHEESSSTTEGGADRSSWKSATVHKVVAVPGKAANSSSKLSPKQGSSINNDDNELTEYGIFSDNHFFLYWVRRLSSIFGFLNIRKLYSSFHYEPDWKCYPGYAAVGIISLVAGLFNPVLQCEPETTTILVTQTVIVTVTRTVVSTQQVLTQTVTVSSPVRLVMTRTIVPPAQTVILPAVTLPPHPPSTVFVTPPTTTPKPLRPVNDPFVPFCVPKKVDELREQLKSMIGRNTGRPLPDEAVPLLEAINFCQFGGTLIPEAAKDIFNGQPPANWRGLSTPSLPPPPASGPERRDDGGEILYVSVSNQRRPWAANVRKDGEPWRRAPSGASEHGENAARLKRQGLATEDSRTDGQEDDGTEFIDRVPTNERREHFINSPGWRPVVQTLMPVFTRKIFDEDTDELNDLFLNSVFVLNTSTSGNGIPLSLPAQKGNATYLQPFLSTVQTDFNPNDITLQVQQFLNRTSQLEARVPLNDRPPLPAPQLGIPPLSVPLSISSSALPLLTSASSPSSPDTIIDSTPTRTESNQNTGPTITEPTQNAGPYLPEPAQNSRPPLTELTLDSPSPLPLTIPSIPETNTEPVAVSELEIPLGGSILPAAPGLRDRFWCGGALVTDRHVITAAHCVVGTAGTGQRPNVIRLGEEDFSTTDERKAVDFRIEEIAFHPQYRAAGEERYYDFAVITLAESAADASFDPYCLVQSPKVLEGRLGTVSGWGQRPNQKTSDVLLDVPVVIRNLRQCEQLYRSHPDFLTKYYPKGFTEALLCASGDRPGEDACRGDSGGPLVLKDPLETLVGVVSTGYGCGDPHYPGIYSRVDAYLDWIDAQIFGSCSKVAFEYRNKAIIAGAGLN